MVIRVGNASAPRWYDMSLSRLDAYIELLLACGATSTELVLHRGESDEQVARVHVLQDDWFPVFDRFLAKGIVCHTHAPLYPRFNLGRWSHEPDEFRSAIAPVMRAVAQFAERQGEATMFVVHGASSEWTRSDESASEAVDWLCAEAERLSPGVIVALELRRPASPHDSRFDRHRTTLTRFVQSLGRANLGICWDVVNDWNTGRNPLEWIAAPDPKFLRLVRHVHLHDIGDSPGGVHYPLSVERVPWRPALRHLVASGYDGAITMEIRYRHALLQGDPWAVLADSYRRLLSFMENVQDERTRMLDAPAGVKSA